MPSKKKKYNARFPAGRIKKIMQTDEEVGKVAQAVPVIISRTLELFVESLLTKTLQITNAKNAKILSPSHMKQCILAESRFDFLKDLVKSLPDASSTDTEDGSSAQSNVPSPSSTTRNKQPRTSISRRRSSEDQITTKRKRMRRNSDDKNFDPGNNPTPNGQQEIVDIDEDEDEDDEDSDDKQENRLTILTPNISTAPNGELDEDYDT